MTIEAGRVLNERYRLVRPVGQGAQASVWIAEHLALGSQVAVKLIDPELAKKQDALDRFRREATAAAQLRSAHVVQILDHGVDDAQPYIVMELLDGHDLFERIDSRGRLSLKETSKIVTQVARALTRAHAAGIVHRDLKPENVFLVPNEDDEIAKVLDFGVAKVADPAKHTMQRTGVGTLLGTPHYMSPEQVKGVSEVDFRTDLWALGVMAYQCVTGELPFDSEGVGDLLIKITIGDAPIPSKVLPSLPATFDSWFAKACNRDADKRFESAREMADALARAVGMPAADTGPASIPRPSRASFSGEQAPKPEVAAKPQPAAPAAEESLPSSALEESTDVDEIAVVESLSIRPPLDSTDVSFEESESSDPIAGTPRPSKRPPPRQVPPVQVGGREAAASPAAPAAGASAHANGSVALPPPPRMPGARPPAAAVSSTVSGLASSGMLSMPPPPELDGSRHRRTKRLVAFAFLAGAGAVAWFAAKPYLTPPRPVAAEPTAAAAAAAPLVEEMPSTRAVALEPDAAAASSAAVDPGRRVAPGAAATATAAPRPVGKGRPKKPTNDGTVEVPDPEREVPLKPGQPQGPPPEPEDPGPPPGD